MENFIGCTIKELPLEDLVAAARTACEHNPANHPYAAGVDNFSPLRLAVLTSKYWGAKGVKLAVSFLDNPEPALRDRLLSHMNAWGTYCNAVFAWSQSGGQVRVSRGGDGYWSYLGTDILHIPAGQPTMTLQGFTMQNSESEFRRVVRHETGHTLGAPHEHARREIIQRLDARRTVA